MENYNDIINLPHYTSKKHKRMSLSSRAIQFAPFSALTGLDEQTNETARLTKEKHELTDEEQNILNNNLQIIKDNIAMHPYITVIYFVEDSKKSGGSYYKISGKVRRFEDADAILIFENNKKISIKQIISINIYK